MKRLLALLRKNPMIDVICTAKGNELPCMLLEPLWGIPYNLYLPFASMYMVSLGVSAFQIGITQTVFFLSQVIFAILSGVLTDKLGRRWCTLIFDTLSWSVPALLWACAQSYHWFLVAAVFNGIWRVTENSWYLLFIEDSAEERYVRLFSVCHIAGLIAGFVSPLAFGFVQKYGVVPTMRVLYLITFVMMTAKFVILHLCTKETQIGKRRMEECRHVSLLSHLWNSRFILLDMLKDKRIMLTVALVASYMTMKGVQDSFWPILVTERLGIAEENLSIFATIKNLLMLVSYFFIVPHVNADKFKHPALWSLLLMALQQGMTILLKPGAYLFVALGAAMEAMALSILTPLTSALQTIAIPAEERARMQGFFFTLCLLVTSPFGMIAGALSDINRALPMGLNIGLLMVCAVFVFWLDGFNRKHGIQNNA
ncbi:MAG: MFS transporter [Clostridiales bacterium]|nr:MFS transporter [Clostridiales bacterium]